MVLSTFGANCVLGMAMSLFGSNQEVSVVHEVVKILAPRGSTDRWFGEAVAIGPGVTVIGVGDNDELGERAGVAYVFDSEQGFLRATLFADDASEFDYFGGVVATDGRIVIVGAAGDDDRGDGSGAAYVFDVLNGQQLLKIAPEDGDALDTFGSSIDVTGDVVIVGAPGDDDGGDSAGAAYVFDASTWALRAKLTANDARAGALFGSETSADGDLVAISAVSDDSGGATLGAVYIFDVTSGQQVSKITYDLGQDSGAFGEAIALNGDVLVVGVPDEDTFGTDAGVAYVFDVTTGVRVGELTPHDSVGYDAFGGSVAISDAGILVGAMGRDERGEESGVAYAFDRNSLLEVAKIVPSDGSLYSRFGAPVGLSQFDAVVGATGDHEQRMFAGAAYVFDIRPSGRPVAGASRFLMSGSQLRREKKEIQPLDGFSGDGFGRSLDVDSSFAVVGASGDDDLGNGSGSAYLVDLDSGQQLHKFLPNDGAESDGFGHSVGLSGEVIIVGSPFDDDLGDTSGGAYLFDLPSRAQIRKLLPLDGDVSTRFGWAVATDGKKAIVGAVGDDDNGPWSGSAYIFDVETGKQLHKIVPLDGGDDDRFGASVGIYGDVAVVGAEFKYVEETRFRTGAAYLFDTNTGEELKRLLPSYPMSHGWFGMSVDIDASRVIVGSYRDEGGWYPWQFGPGFAFVFDRVSGLEILKLTSLDQTSYDRFGSRVSLDGPVAVVGAEGHDGIDRNVGAAYLFDAMSGEQIARLIGRDLESNDTFGRSVAVSGERAVVGDGDSLGAVYAFDASIPASRWGQHRGGVPGSYGLPFVRAIGGLSLGGELVLRLYGAPPYSSVTLVIGSSFQQAPFGGGLMIPSNDFNVSGLVTDGNGHLELAGVLPPDAPTGQTLYFQFWVQDPTAVDGLAASHAMSGVVVE